MIVLLMMLYPRIKLSELVGTDLVQAIPLVSSAAIGHLMFGDFQLGLSASILVGSIPGVFVGALFSTRAPDHVIRPALMVVLLVSSLKLLGAPTSIVAATGAVSAVVGVVYAVRRGRENRERKRELERTVVELDEPRVA